MPTTGEPVNEYYKDYWERREQYLSDRHKALLDKSQQIAAEMGEGWSARVVRDNGGAILNHIVHLKHFAYEYVIVMRFDERTSQDRLRFRNDGSFFDNKAIHQQGSHITVAANKQARVIARDIERRLLPELREFDNDAKKNHAEAQRYDNAVSENMWKLINASRAHLQHSKAPHQQNVVTYYNTHGARIEASVYEHYVHLHLDSLSIEKAEAVLRLLFGEEIRK